MTRVYLVRHATHALVGKVLVGRMPGVPLSEEGRQQAESLATQFADGPVPASLLSSPRERCRETAAPIAARCGTVVDISDALDEIDYGDWTGREFASLDGDSVWRAWNEGRASASVPGGEAAKAVSARVMDLLARLASEDRPSVALVTHADVIKSAVLGLIGASLDAHHRIEIDTASITTIDLWRGGGKVVRSNQAVAA